MADLEMDFVVGTWEMAGDISVELLGEGTEASGGQGAANLEVICTGTAVKVLRLDELTRAQYGSVWGQGEGKGLVTPNFLLWAPGCPALR